MSPNIPQRPGRRCLVFLPEPATVRRMSDFDDIRPYNDAEVSDAVARITGHADFPTAAARLVLPPALRGNALARWCAAQWLTWRTRRLRSVDACQRFIAGYFERLIDTTTDGVTVSGLEHLPAGGTFLFVSNHRDIVLDSGLLNFLIHQAGHATCRIAVGDNLFTHALATDLMRLNKSFIVHRSAANSRAAYRSLEHTSAYIRASLEAGTSIWIAQREGRAKDGFDRTDPALVKMLALAHKDTEEPLAALLERCHVIPVSISYELDPCAPAKARELYVRARDGEYDKTEDEDLQSILAGLLGNKGRVHLHFGERVCAGEDTPAAVAHALDQQIVRGLRVYPTHMAAAMALGEAQSLSADVLTLAAVEERFNQQLEALTDEERPFLLLQYANMLRNRAETRRGKAPAKEPEPVANVENLADYRQN